MTDSWNHPGKNGHLDVFKGFKIILASSSPRRREILAATGLDFHLEPSNFEEDLPKLNFQTPEEYVLQTATLKAEEVYDRVKHSNKTIQISADTIVVYPHHFVDKTDIGEATKNGDIVVEKPRDAEHAKAILHTLSGKSHRVLTAVHLLLVINNQSYTTHFVESTTVTFANLSEKLIDAYVASGEPKGKAGGYGLQSNLGSILVSKIEGCSYNAIGLPMSKLYFELEKLLEKANYSS